MPGLSLLSVTALESMRVLSLIRTDGTGVEAVKSLQVSPDVKPIESGFTQR